MKKVICAGMVAAALSLNINAAEGVRPEAKPFESSFTTDDATVIPFEFPFESTTADEISVPLFPIAANVDECGFPLCSQHDRYSSFPSKSKMSNTDEQTPKISVTLPTIPEDIVSLCQSPSAAELYFELWGEQQDLTTQDSTEVSTDSVSDSDKSEHSQESNASADHADENGTTLYRSLTEEILYGLPLPQDKPLFPEFKFSSSPTVDLTLGAHSGTGSPNTDTDQQTVSSADNFSEDAAAAEPALKRSRKVTSCAPAQQNMTEWWEKKTTQTQRAYMSSSKIERQVLGKVAVFVDNPQQQKQILALLNEQTFSNKVNLVIKYPTVLLELCNMPTDLRKNIVKLIALFENAKATTSVLDSLEVNYHAFSAQLDALRASHPVFSPKIKRIEEAVALKASGND